MAALGHETIFSVALFLELLPSVVIENNVAAADDAVEKVLYLRPSIQGDFRSFLSTATGYGTVGMKNGKPFVEVRSGSIEVRAIKTA